MKFKDGAIKPGMAIHCPKEEDAKALLEYLDAEGYIWEDTLDHLTNNTRYDEGDTYFLDYIKGEDITFLRVTHDSRDWAIENGYTPTEFSDLIEPDSPVNSPADSPMSAVEVLEWFHKYYENADVMRETFNYDFSNALIFMLEHISAEDVVDKITAHEAAKKAPKPIEIEWIDICRIIQIQDNGFKKCVYEEVLPDNDGCVDYQNAENILKKYISEHEGRYIAVNEGICRVKEDE